MPRSLWRGTLGTRSHIIRPYSSRSHFNARYFQVSEEVLDAVQTDKPVVALETTIYTHGWPHPDNLRLAEHLELLVRKGGAVPATIGVLDGVARVGLQGEDLVGLLEARKPRKVSRRDLGYILGSGRHMNGGTTISGTMVLAHLAGIKVFATGGLGGVHRGGQDSLDISADLTELGRTPVAVISSGCKGFLDIPRTLEFLETQGAGVGTFADGREGEIDFPAFWSRDSGIKSPTRIENEEHAAHIIHAHNALGLSSGLHLANPVPEEHGIPRNDLEKIIGDALVMADQAGASGSANTPFVLDAIKELSGGQSVKANWALIEANTKRGTEVAKCLCEIESKLGNDFTAQSFQRQVKSHRQEHEAPENLAGRTEERIEYYTNPSSKFQVIVAGAFSIDRSCNYRPLGPDSARTQPRLNTSNPAEISISNGGVGFNVARAAHLSGAKVKFCSVVGRDWVRKVQKNVQKAGLDPIDVLIHQDGSLPTAQYTSFNDTNKNLTIAMADMRVLEKPFASFDTLWSPRLEKFLSLRDPKMPTQWLVADANWDSTTLHQWLSAGKQRGLATAYEPVSVEKAKRLFARQLDDSSLEALRFADLAAPNSAELLSLHETASSAGYFENQRWWETIDALGISASGARSELVKITSEDLVNEGIPQSSIQLSPFIPTIMTKLGPKGVLLTRLLFENDPLLLSRSQFVVSRSKTGNGGIGGLYMQLIAPEKILPPEEIVSVNGAGDSFLGALIAQLATRKDSNFVDAITFAQRASMCTLQSEHSVGEDIRNLH